MNTPSAEPAALDDATIVRGLHRGDRAAWTALYQQYSVRIWRYSARLMGSDAAVTADVVQETFLAAARSARQFDASRGTLWSWLAGIAHHQVSRHWRKASRHARLTTHLTGNGEHVRDATAALTIDSLFTSEDPAAALQAAETSELVRWVLAQLPSDYASLLAARYLDELTLAEMQPLFGGSLEALRSRLHRARVEFRTQFERAAADPRSSPVATP